MGKPYLYTVRFKPLGTYDQRFWVMFRKNIINYYNYEYDNPIERTPFDHLIWFFPLYIEPRSDLYAIIIYIAKFTRTKIMFKEFLIEDQIKKGFLIIGERTRMIICRHILNYAIEGILKHEDWLRKNKKDWAKAHGWTSIMRFCRSITFSKLDEVIYPIIALYTINDPSYINRLNNYIMGQYKLDYKNYGQFQNAYYNAVSKRFYPRRMML